MSRRTSTNSSDDDTLSEECIPTLPILTRSQQRRFIQEQQTVIESLIRDFSPYHQVFYTLFDTPRIVRDGALEEIMCVQEAFNEIIFDQRSRSVWMYHTRTLPEGTFTLRWCMRDDIPEGPPQYDSDGNEVRSDEESDWIYGLSKNCWGTDVDLKTAPDSPHQSVGCGTHTWEAMGMSILMFCRSCCGCSRDLAGKERQK